MASLIVWLALSAVLHMTSLVLLRRSAWPRRFLAGVARIAGVRLQVDGIPAQAPVLLVANHRSWLDIPVLAAATGCAFVAKDELRGHWLLGWLCTQNRTVFVNRGDRRSVGLQAERIGEALVHGPPLVLFAEGTVSPKEGLLPFRPALLAAVAPAPDGVSVRPLAIDYGVGRVGLVWPGSESGLANFCKVMGRRGRLHARVTLLPEVVPSTDRKQIARAAQDAIAAALALPNVASLSYTHSQS